MVQPGIGLDTPRTNLGDMTYLSQKPEFDISQEMSFQSPSKDKNNLVEQLKNGRRGAIRTPRARAPLGDRRNLPTFAGGGEFTPLLKSATRNSALRIGKENGTVPATPAFLRAGELDNIDENTPLPAFGSSIYNESNNGYSMSGTPAPVIQSSSAASTPMAIPARRGGKDVLNDGNQLSLREQENVIDKIEKENFGLKLKIHFLEEALRKAGPGFSEAALKENTELKVDKVTMQKELFRYRKNLSNAEKDLEDYRRQLVEMQERYKHKARSEDQREEMKMLQHGLEEREQEVRELRDKLQDAETEALQVDKLRDEIVDLEADLREKERMVEDRDDELENLKAQLEEKAAAVLELEGDVKQSKRREVELEEQAQTGEELEEAHETIDELERDIQRLKTELEEAKEEKQEAVTEKERAVSDLEELQDEIANKSMTSKGLNRQMEEKMNRLSDELEDLKETHAELKEQHVVKTHEVETLSQQLQNLKQKGSSVKEKLREDFEIAEDEREKAVAELKSHQDELKRKSDEKELLQSRHDALTAESASLQEELKEAKESIGDLEYKLDHEKTLALQSEREIRDQYKSEIDRLNDEIEDLRAELREKERLLDDDNDKGDSERRNLESQLDQAEERANGLQRTLDKLQEVETTMSGKEMKMKEALDSENQRHADEEALLKKQIEELNQDVETRRLALDELRSELSSVKEELRLSHREQKALAEKVEGLEDEIEVLQTSLDDESEQARNDINAVKREAQTLREELYVKKLELQKAESAQSEPRESSFFRETLNTRLQDIEAQLTKVRKEKQTLHDQLSEITIELASVKAQAADFESERDEYRHQVEQLQGQGDNTGRLDQEKIELRTTKMRLDNEVRRAKDEIKMLGDQLQATERELQEEIERAGEEEARLNGNILELQKKISASSSDRELQSSKRTIQQLEQRVLELESHAASASPSRSPELSMLRHDLSTLRHKESEYLSRENSQKEAVRTLKRQVAELERKSHDLEMSQLHTNSPSSSASNSARKSELSEVRTQLQQANSTLKDLRSQIKESERETARKVNALTLEIQANAATWDLEKDRLEADLDSAILAKEGLQSQNTVLEQTVSRLKSKISHLEKELQSSRRTGNHDNTMALERSELHEMLRETQIRASELEMELADSSKQVEKIASKESELRVQLKRVREERSAHKESAKEAARVARRVEAEFANASAIWAEEKGVYRERAHNAIRELRRLETEYADAIYNWEEEKRRLTKGVRFANQSLSTVGGSPAPESQQARHSSSSALRTSSDASGTIEAAHHQHQKELRGLMLQIQWLQALIRREEGLRSDAAFAKRYMGLQIEQFEMCNKADLALLRASGHAPRTSENDVPTVAAGTKRPSLKLVMIMVRAAVRMRRGAQEWRHSLAIRDKVQDSLAELRHKRAVKAKAAAVSSAAALAANQHFAAEELKIQHMAERLARESIKSPAARRSLSSSQRQQHSTHAHVSSNAAIQGMDSSSLDTLRFRMWGGGKGGDVWSGEATLKRMRKEAAREERRRSLGDSAVKASLGGLSAAQFAEARRASARIDGFEV